MLELNLSPCSFFSVSQRGQQFLVFPVLAYAGVPPIYLYLWLCDLTALGTCKALQIPIKDGLFPHPCAPYPISWYLWKASSFSQFLTQVQTFLTYARLRCVSWLCSLSVVGCCCHPTCVPLLDRYSLNCFLLCHFLVHNVSQIPTAYLVKSKFFCLNFILSL